jgi:hypothetical protein
MTFLEVIEDRLHPLVPIIYTILQLNFQLVLADGPINMIVSASVDAPRFPIDHAASKHLLQGPIDRTTVPTHLIGQFIRSQRTRLSQFIIYIDLETVEVVSALDQVMARTDLGHHLFGQHDRVPLYERLIK